MVNNKITKTEIIKLIKAYEGLNSLDETLIGFLGPDSNFLDQEPYSGMFLILDVIQNHSIFAISENDYSSSVDEYSHSFFQIMNNQNLSSEDKYILLTKKGDQE